MKPESSRGKQAPATAAAFIIAAVFSFFIVSAARKWRSNSRPMTTAQLQEAERRKRREMFRQIMNSRVPAMDVLLAGASQDDQVLAQVFKTTVNGITPLPEPSRKLLADHIKAFHSN
ncbi:MAG: hypothetical protein JSS86_03955 [Cyanobacteria bacterium SZAS LIN-2]|nr:hypothetical protein [Cyanobacteria bacterium SZAS LIN-2]